MNEWLKKRPSVTSMPGRSTPEMSKWPQGCGKYQAAVKSGAVDLAMLSGVLPLVSSEVVQVDCVGVLTEPLAVVAGGFTDGQDVVRVGMTPASEASSPFAVAMMVSGVSAETENDAPHQAGIV